MKIFFLGDIVGKSGRLTVIKNLKDTLDSQTAIIVTHKPSLLELVDRVIVMDNGKVVLDDKKDIVLKKLQKRD